MGRVLRGVGYVLRKFPVLSETFVLNEILALERAGLAVHVFALAPTRDPRFHEGLARLKATVHYAPDLADWRALLRYNRRFAALDRAHYAAELGRGLFPRFEPWRFLQAGWIADRVRRERIAHLHAHFAHFPTAVAWRAARLAGVPFSFTAHAFDIYREGDARDLARKLRAARFTVTVSDYNVGHLRSLPGAGDARIELVRNGIDLMRFAPPSEPAPPEPFTILAVARLVEKKGLVHLVEACRLLRERGARFRCRIVGKGAERARLEAAVRAAELQGVVELLGPLTQHEVLARYHEAHVLALPCVVGADGNRDGLPVSIVEALACGLPVVSTPVTGIPEVVRDGENGLIVPQADAPALADALESLLRAPERRARLAAAARPSVLATFDEQRTAARLVELFDACGAAAPPPSRAAGGRARRDAPAEGVAP